MSRIRMKAPAGNTDGISQGNARFELDEEGHVHVPVEMVPAAQSLGFAIAHRTDDDGNIIEAAVPVPQGGGDEGEAEGEDAPAKAKKVKGGKK